jgi:hypothetical protein
MCLWVQTLMPTKLLRWHEKRAFYIAHFRAYIYVLVELTNKCTMFLFYIYFHFFLDMFWHLHAILKGSILITWKFMVHGHVTFKKSLKS